MIIVELRGGLGNQMFTYAIGYSLSKEYNTKLIIDTRIYNTYYKIRDFDLLKFNIDYRDLLFNKTWFVGHKYLYKIINILQLLFLQARIVREQKEFVYQELPAPTNNNLYLSGFWQNYRYFHKYKQDISRQFRMIDLSPECLKLIGTARKKHTIALHIRRGDYTTFQGGKCLKFNYYIKGLDFLKECGVLNEIWVFSDDIEYCKKALNGRSRIHFVNEHKRLNDCEEFSLMCNCAYFIIANSTYSWWAAYLSDFSEKIVVAPVVDMWKKEFYLPDWKTIKADLE